MACEINYLLILVNLFTSVGIVGGFGRGVLVLHGRSLSLRLQSEALRCQEVKTLSLVFDQQCSHAGKNFKLRVRCKDSSSKCCLVSRLLSTPLSINELCELIYLNEIKKDIKS